MSQCKKFAPNIFHKTKCSNCFRQKEEHTAEALECNRASRSIARSGYLFVAPDWDFSVPLNRTKRWQRRWFVLYDDGELNYSVDEHPDTVPQGSVDMSQILEVTGAEQITGHPHSLALTGPDRVTFVKAASREDARWWAELLAVFPRRHKRNATFPGGRASPSLPQLGRSASPQPPRPRHLSCSGDGGGGCTKGASPRTNFTTPPLKEERESPPKEAVMVEEQQWEAVACTRSMPIETNVRTDYNVLTSGSPPTRDKLRCEDKARARRDWRNERLRDIATALTDRSPESSLALPAEALLHLKKGWLWVKDINNEWLRRWIVLCGPTLSVFRDQDENIQPEFSVEMATVISYSEIATETKYGFQIQSNGGSATLILSAVTAGIRSNWLQALKKAAPHVTETIPTTTLSSAPATPRSGVFLSSDDEYRTASEGGRRGSTEDWGELPPSPPLARTASLARVKEKARARPRLPRCQSRQSTLDSVSTDELDTSSRDSTDGVDLKNTINKQKAEIDDLQKQLGKAIGEMQMLEEEIIRLKKLHSESLLRERNAKDVLCLLEESERKNVELETKYLREQKQLKEMENYAKTTEEQCNHLTKELQNKQLQLLNLKEELRNANEKIKQLEKTVTETTIKKPPNYDSLTNLTNIDLDLDFDTLTHNELIEYCLDLKTRFEKAILEIRAVKRELKASYGQCDDLELRCFSWQRRYDGAMDEMEVEKRALVARIEHLTGKLMAVEKQARIKARQEAKDKRRSLSLKGRESFSINKEVEDKVTELEAKILTMERTRSKRRHNNNNKRERSSERNSPIDDRSLRRLRRKSLDSATASESMKLLMRLSTLEQKVSSVAASNESLSDAGGGGSLAHAREKLNDCLNQIGRFKNGRSKRSPSPNSERLNLIEHALSDVCDVLNNHVCCDGGGDREAEVVLNSANGVVKQLQELLIEKLTSLAEKRRQLKQANKLDVRAKLELLAEKIAFENVLIGRIQGALLSPPPDEPICGRLFTKEVKETGFLIEALRNKLMGNAEKSPPVCKTGVEYLSGVLATILNNATKELRWGRRRRQNFQIPPPPPTTTILADEQRNINALFETYKKTHLPQLAESLANETFTLQNEKKSYRMQFLNDETIADLTKTAENAIDRELIETEINHVMLRAAQLYKSHASADNGKFFFAFFAAERAALELWSDSVETHFYETLNVCIDELSEYYVNALLKLQRQNWRRRLEWERGRQQQQQVAAAAACKQLEEFADIVAHKSLIDARLSVLNGHTRNTNDFFNDDDDDLSVLLADEQSSVQMNQSLEAEFKCMLDRYSMECGMMVMEEKKSSSMMVQQQVLDCFRELCCVIRDLKRDCGGDDADDDDETIVVDSLEDVCKKCFCLIKELEEIRRVVQEVNVSSFENEQENEKRPVVLRGTGEYLNQMENLRAAYRKAIAAYETDKKQRIDLAKLQNQCERVLIAMEQWHRRTVQDLRESHNREMQRLRDDKEQALAEETQATLAALDAMRKAHEAEVQREVARFKQDFVRQQRDELIDLSERLSVKCLEAAALEEQLSSATRQLAHAQQHILQLERNPQLSTLQN